jgi:hypothetical protein
MNKTIECCSCNDGIHIENDASSQRMYGWDSFDLALLFDNKNCKTALFCNQCVPVFKKMKHIFKILEFVCGRKQ